MNTPLRNIRIADDLWTQAQQVAAVRHETVTDAVRRCLTRYVEDNQEQQP